MGIRDRLAKALDEGLDASKDFLQKAKEKAQDLGEKGSHKLEIMKLEHQAEKKFALLGTNVFETLVEKNQETVSKGTPAIKALIQDLIEIEKKIDEHEALMKE